jgi:acetyl esterase/lipase
MAALWLGRGDDRVVLYFHGGGYVFGSPRTHAAMLARLARHGGLRAVLPEYRLAPEAPFPAAVEDARTAWAALLARGTAPGRVVIGGDSAGGGLALALLGDLLERGAPLPAGVFAFSPLTDLGFSGASFAANAAAEVLLPAARAAEMAALYLQGADPLDPMASPLFADFTGAPPVLLMAGDTEILLDDTRRMADRMRRQGVAVCEQIARDLPHVWPLFWRYLPEGDAALRTVAAWIRRLPRH